MSEQNDVPTSKFKAARAAWRALARAESEIARLRAYRSLDKKMRDDLAGHFASETASKRVLRDFFEKEFPGEEAQD